MNIETGKRGKRVYVTPQTMRITLDSEISLALESSPPLGPDETVMNNTPEYFRNEPFGQENMA